ncbi:FAD-NAD(P)-binding [Austwickia chelonae]|uniref:FAD-dependent urate hydroxylase HpyO/Asp monooxygenase CreE-like FAD/NAD(P)-binding domain-containing protein n=1 Tax=Austwickia chelonae NBRC 105200 TaxID=1184607 RepID=K6VNW6_9MICO|nr:FAD/NAD(P)-binding protein [Austwickia chelonae]GAB78429.1 hypothetical protein AUCHE_09_00350 [Austwickia chelonae NBRC 105200]SEW39440.1 FAD-NAD(P)-binding [Austwickia chelonae]
MEGAPAMRIGILGSGASATLLATSLARSGEELDLFCFDDHPLGSTLAFDPTSEAGECNTSASVNRSYLRGLGANHPETDPEVFPPRCTIGREIVQAAAEVRGSPTTALHENLGKVETAEHSPSGITVHPQDGTPVTGLSRIYLCRGLSEPKIPATFTHIADHPAVVTDPYPLSDTVTRLTGQDVLVVGTNLSAVEIALELVDHGGTVTMASRQGLLPSVRRVLPDDPDLMAEWRRRLAGDIPSSAEETATLIVRSAAELDRPFPTDDPTKTPRKDLLEKEIDDCDRETHWSELIIPLARVLNRSPEAARPGSEAMEGPPLRRYTNAIPLDTACRLRQALTEETLRITTIGPLLEAGELADFRLDDLDRPRRFDAVVLACGWELPGPVPGLPDRWVSGRSSDLRRTGPWAVPIGIEAHDVLAVPNGLFAAEDQIRGLATAGLL